MLDPAGARAAEQRARRRAAPVGAAAVVVVLGQVAVGEHARATSTVLRERVERRPAGAVGVADDMIPIDSYHDARRVS